MGKDQHVVPCKTGGWNVKGAGNSKATKHTNTQAEAYAYARTISINQKSELFTEKTVKLESVIPTVMILILRKDNNTPL
jgi:hypothetical protein